MGLEKLWIQRMVALTAPVRVTPTEEYFRSFYYQIDSISDASDYNYKTIDEKLQSPTSNPYQADIDPEIPSYWPQPDVDANGALKDLSKEVMKSVKSITNIPGLVAYDYQMAVSNIRLRLIRPSGSSLLDWRNPNQTFLNQSSYLASFDQRNPQLFQTSIVPEAADIGNLLYQLSLSATGSHIEEGSKLQWTEQDELIAQAKNLLALVKIKTLETPSEGWEIPSLLWPTEGIAQACVIQQNGNNSRIILPSTTYALEELIHILAQRGISAQKGQVFFSKKAVELEVNEQTYVISKGLFLPPKSSIAVDLNYDSLNKLKALGEIQFNSQFKIQGLHFSGTIPYQGLVFSEVEIQRDYQDSPTQSPPWLYRYQEHDTSLLSLPNTKPAHPVLLAKHFRESGVLIGDTGHLSYYSPTSSSIQEQRIPLVVAGFYDPGIIPIGGKFVMVDKTVTALVQAAISQQTQPYSTGFNIWFDDLANADQVKEEILLRFKDRNIAKYWKVETYKEYDFSRDLIQQLASEKNLWTLLAGIILLVACSNIVSMLILLVNDKKKDIGILQAMGARRRSIALIFGTCGLVMGIAGSLIGITMAVLTFGKISIPSSRLRDKLQGPRRF